ncbi:DUF6159 family protein [Natrarchaeobius chitinivorans]|uniref:Glycerophosphoryl diester phosphodiesterase membrane domain-containing protein n=1 Tax=Natrarchaeobius chitinivorans TaxID=1679083 RepID=A0A3N6MCG3_NATCH|nr:DUF6159 family protein [Natrarchaeobius chitinivorans]RQG94220.1 hypothetical protein EA473_12675 [Natrarchaeobius chitinivorans]
MSLGSNTGRGRIGFFDRLKTGWTLTKDSISVIRHHPWLMLFPLLAGIASIGFFVFFFFPLLIANLLGTGLEYAVLFVLYFITTFVSTYFSAALVYGANEAFHGREPGVLECLEAVSDRIGPIFVWSIIAATVSVVLKSLEESDNPIASILGTLFAIGWSIMTFFIVPVIVFEDVSVTSMFKRSGATFKDTWGETLGAGFGITLIVTAIGIGLVAIALVVSIPIATVFPGPGILLAVLLVGGAFVFTYLLSQTIWGIAKTALYVYAVEGNAPDEFDNFDFETLGGRTEQSGTPGTSSKSAPRMGD